MTSDPLQPYLTGSLPLWTLPKHWYSPYIQSPLLLQYDPQFGDAFWNSSKYGMVTYLLRMMTSWAIVCSVWYLPPMTREVGVYSPPVQVFVCCGVQESGRVFSFILCYRKMKMLCSLLTG